MTMTVMATAVLSLATTQLPLDTRGVDIRCGAYCLSVSLSGLEISSASLTDVLSTLGAPGPAGYSLAQLDEAARHFGAHTLLVETDLRHLTKRKQPFACIVRLSGDHFVNVQDVDSKYAYLLDAPRDYSLPIDTFRGLWDGNALLISATPLHAAAGHWRYVIVTGVLLVTGCGIGLLRFMLRKRQRNEHKH